MATPSTTTNSLPASPPSISSPSSSPTSPPHPPAPSPTMNFPLYGDSLHLHPILFSDLSFPLLHFSFSSSSSSKPAHQPSFSMVAPSTSTQSSPATLPSLSSPSLSLTSPHHPPPPSTPLMSPLPTWRLPLTPPIPCWRPLLSTPSLPHTCFSSSSSSSSKFTNEPSLLWQLPLPPPNPR